MLNPAAPEIALWTAVMGRALLDLNVPEESVSARRWFGADSQGIGSFTWVCHSLDLDPVAVRERLL